MWGGGGDLDNWGRARTGCNNQSCVTSQRKSLCLDGIQQGAPAHQTQNQILQPMRTGPQLSRFPSPVLLFLGLSRIPRKISKTSRIFLALVGKLLNPWKISRKHSKKSRRFPALAAQKSHRKIAVTTVAASGLATTQRTRPY